MVLAPWPSNCHGPSTNGDNLATGTPLGTVGQPSDHNNVTIRTPAQITLPLLSHIVRQLWWLFIDHCCQPPAHRAPIMSPSLKLGATRLAEQVPRLKILMQIAPSPAYITLPPCSGAELANCCGSVSAAAAAIPSLIGLPIPPPSRAPSEQGATRLAALMPRLGMADGPGLRMAMGTLPPARPCVRAALSAVDGRGCGPWRGEGGGRDRQGSGVRSMLDGDGSMYWRMVWEAQSCTSSALPTDRMQFHAIRLPNSHNTDPR